MKKLMWKRAGVVLGAVALVGTGLALTLPSSDAAINQPVRVIRCKGDKSHLFETIAGLRFDIATTGFLDAGVGDPFKLSDGRTARNLTVEDVFSTGQADGLGDASFSLDRSREAGPSGIVANQASSDFPATQTMRFHFTAKIGGVEYRSANAATVTNSEVRAFPPPPGTTYVLSNEVSLVDANGKSAGTLRPGRAFTVH
ncbi:MAG TPA: hypothetical protein VE685_25440 [Thermoanaerobaculia bacterium]|nr:hypothetical protein [Thermoanaerobaculia bacterium]